MSAPSIPTGSTSGTIAVLRNVASTITGATGLTIVTMVLLSALFAPWVATHHPDAIDVMNRFKGPSLANWLGT
ncbi:MAG: ABC transporter permease, partial [Bosea sp. (in: a-proteobacteria)]